MKKIKLLTPIVGVVACATPLFATVSCGNNETEEEVKAFDENVEKEYEIIAGNDGRYHTISLHNFQFKNDRETWGLKVEVINQSSSLTRLYVEEEGGVAIFGENQTMCNVQITADGIFNTEEITFDLKFTNKRGQEFISTGYSINAKIIFWPEDNPDDYYANVCVTIDGKDRFFESYQLCDEYINGDTDVYDIYGNSYKRSKFNGEVYIRDMDDDDGWQIVIGADPFDDLYVYQGFLSNMPSFNSPVHVGAYTTLANNFLCHDNKFNSPVTFEYGVYVEADFYSWAYFNFLSYNKEFNQPLDLSNLYFYGEDVDYADGASILAECDNMVSEIKFDGLQIDDSLIPWWAYGDGLVYYLSRSFAVTSPSAPAYKQGMKITCGERGPIDKMFPNFDEYDGEFDYLYRKLVITELGKR